MLNSKSLLAVVALAAFAGTAAHADDITIDNTPFQSTATRAQVQAELGQYRQSGVNPWSTSYNPLKGFQSGVTREQVRAEFLADRAEVAALTSEDGGSAYLTKQAFAARAVPVTNLAGTPANTAR